MEKSIDYRSPIDEDFQDPNWDSERIKSNKEVIPKFIFVDGNSKLKSFSISNVVVSQKLYTKVIGINSSLDVDELLPVENVSWFEAIEFCNKLSLLKRFEPFYKITENGIAFNLIANGYRLPYKREWIFAAVGGDKKNTFKFAGSNILSDVGWFNSNSSCRIQIPGQKESNSIGLYDMSGNIWEWTNDYIESNIIVCGGSVISSSEECEILKQGQKSFPPETKNQYIGFRLVKN